MNLHYADPQLRPGPPPGELAGPSRRRRAAALALRRAPRLAHVMEQALDALPHAIFLLDGGGRLLRANRAGVALLAQDDGPRLAGSCLELADGPEAVRLRRLIVQAGTERRSGALALRTAGRGRPVSVIAAPLGHAGDKAEAAAVLVCVTDLEAPARGSAARLASLFGLTPAEARLACALFEGASLKEAARGFGVSPNTVQNQLARVFAKTGTSRQSELIRLMMRAGAFEAG